MSIERLSRLLLVAATLCAAGTVEESVVESLNRLYKTSISEATEAYYRLESTLLSTPTSDSGLSSHAVVLNATLSNQLFLHFFLIRHDGEALVIAKHTIANYSDPLPEEFFQLDQYIHNVTNITVTDGRLIISEEKQTLTVETQASVVNFTLISREFYNDTKVVYAAMVTRGSDEWEYYIAARNATQFDQLVNSSLAEPFYYLVFAAFVAVVLTYAAVAYYWQRNNTLPFLKRREDQHFQFDMGTGRSSTS